MAESADISEGRCVTCGFLSRCSASPEQATVFFEMPPSARKRGGGWWAFQVGGIGTATMPACCVGAAQLMAEIKAIDPSAFDWRTKDWEKLEGEARLATVQENFANRRDAATPSRNAAAKTVFDKDRKCPEWFPYTQGLGPEQHIQNYAMQRLENERRKWEIDIEKSRRRFEIFLAFVASFIGIAAIIVALLVAPKDSWLLCKMGWSECIAETHPDPKPY